MGGTGFNRVGKTFFVFVDYSDAWTFCSEVGRCLSTPPLSFDGEALFIITKWLTLIKFLNPKVFFFGVGVAIRQKRFLKKFIFLGAQISLIFSLGRSSVSGV